MIGKIMNFCHIPDFPDLNLRVLFSSFMQAHVVKCSLLPIKNVTLTSEIERPISLVVLGKLTFLYFTIHLKRTRLNLSRFLTC